MPEGGAMNLLVAGVSWPPETFLHRLILGLGDRGFNVTVASAERPRDAGIRWLRLTASSMSRIGRTERFAGEVAYS